ncbi:MAG: two component transcriptional regulator, LuxR family, partial [Lacunisphaera sp.]|nr:two component transcriptional regulator, LuxR family [Lacunisphaera sp.]
MTTAIKSIDILIVDDSELVRTGLRTLLNAHAKTADAILRVVGEAHSANTAVTEAARLKPDIVLMDIRLPDGSGLEACRRILAHEAETKVL